MGKNSGAPQNFGQSVVGTAKDAVGLGKKTIQSGVDFWTGAPDTPDFGAAAAQQGAANAGAVNAQTNANRPGQNTPFGFTQWSQNPDGTWTQNTGLQGGLGAAATGLQGQAAGLAKPFDFSQFGELDDGSAAREQAINASFDQQASRLNPMFANREDSMRTELANQGLDPNSQAARGARSDFNTARNDAFSGAMNSAIREGTAAQQATFGQNMAARQQQIAEALKGRQLPMEELAALQGFTQMPGFMGAGAAAPTPYLQALMLQGGFDMQKWLAQQQMAGDIMGGVGEAANAGASAIGPLAAAAPALAALSDMRAKRNIRPLGLDAMPGVPLVEFEYLEGLGAAGKHVGVLAQDLERVSPRHVSERADGLKVVDYSFMGGK